MSATARYNYIFRVGILLTAIFAFGLVNSGNVAAQEAEEAEVTTEVSGVSSEDFVYEAQAGDNLTILVRRSLQLVAEEQGVQLDTATTIAAETCAVQELGAFMLDIGDEVIIPTSVLSDAIAGTGDLSADALARWEAFAPIDEDLADVRPVTAPEFVDSSELVGGDDTDSQPDDNSDELSVIDSIQTEIEDAEVDDDTAPWYWWIIGGGAVGAMWYVLGGNEVIASRNKGNVRKAKKRS